MELVTGRKGSAHITSQQDRMKHQGVFGEGAYILKTGQMLEPQVQSSNEIRIRDGALMVQGALGCVKVNTYDPVTIQNGSQGMKRIDLICWQYTYDAEQDVESAEWVVIQGTPAESDPQQPAYTDGDIQQGDSPVQVPVFAVELDGINVTGVTTLLPTAPSLEELNSNSKEAMLLKQYEYDNRTIPAGEYEVFSLNFPLLDGYTRMLWTVSQENASSGGVNASYTSCYWTEVVVGSPTLNVAIRNNASSSAKIKIILRVIYAKTSLI